MSSAAAAGFLRSHGMRGVVACVALRRGHLLARTSGHCPGCRSKHQLVPFGEGEDGDHHVATLQLSGTGRPASVSSSTTVAATAPPLVLLGGTAQTINSWVGHHKHLAKGRTLLQYDLRGQGRTSLPVSNCTLRRHVADFEELVVRRLRLPTPVDLVGFSFGGRVALAIAAERPDIVRRLVLSGVPLDRGAEGRLILKGWTAALQADQLEAMLWQSVVASHAPSFLRAHEGKFPAWVASAARANSTAGLLAILSQTHHDDPDDSFHAAQLALRVGGRAAAAASTAGTAAATVATADTATADTATAAPRSRKRVLVVAGTEDRIAPAAEVGRLAQALRAGGAAVEEVHLERAGHMMAIEQPAAWRAAVLRFLNDADDDNDDDDQDEVSGGAGGSQSQTCKRAKAAAAGADEARRTRVQP